MVPIFFNYTCSNCGNKFLSPGLPDQAYGLFLIRTVKNEIAFLDSFEDKVFDELKRLFDQEKVSYIWIDESNWVKIFHLIFSMTCDLSPLGSVYRIGQSPICPQCHSHDMASWIQTNPPQIGEEDLPVVTHEAWNKLSLEEKKATIEKGIQEYFDKYIRH